MSSFTDLMNKKSKDVLPPQPMPNGTYLCVVEGQPKKTEVGDDKTDVFDFNLKPIQATGDVNQQELAEYLAKSGFAGLANASIRARFFITEKALYRLTNFLNACGVEEGELTVVQRIPMATGRQVLVRMKQSPSADMKTMYSNPEEYMKV